MTGNAYLDSWRRAIAADERRRSYVDTSNQEGGTMARAQWYGSILNRIAEDHGAPASAPAVGTPGFKSMWSDRNPVQVTKVLSPTAVEVAEVRVLEWKNNYGVRFGVPIEKVTYPREIVKRGKDGRWRTPGGKANGTVVVFGRYEAYRDPSF